MCAVHGRIVAVLGCALLWMASAGANERPRVAPHRVIGLLQWPELFGEHGCAPRDAHAAPVYADPALGRFIGELRAPGAGTVACAPPRVHWQPLAREAERDLPSAEFESERPAAVVLERAPGAARIALGDGRSGWVRLADERRLLGLARLLRDALAFVAADWDGVLHDSPNAAAPRQRVDAAARQRAGRGGVEVLQVAEHGGQTWIEIELGRRAGCADGAEPAAMQRGWLRAYGASGWPRVWFHPRGC